MWLENVFLAVNSTILYTQKFAERVDLMVSVLITKTSSKRTEEASVGEGHVYGIQSGDVYFRAVYLSPNS